jgi:hypothetical protein
VSDLSWEADWVERNTGRTLTPDEARCVDALSAIQRPYNWSLIGDGWRDTASLKDPHPSTDDEEPPVRRAVIFGGRFVVVRITNGLSTWDFDDLTRLVLAAHRNAVRVDVAAEMYRAIDKDADLMERSDTGEWVATGDHPEYPQACLRIMLHARQREGGTAQRHPTIEEAVERHTAKPRAEAQQ